MTAAAFVRSVAHVRRSKDIIRRLPAYEDLLKLPKSWDRSFLLGKLRHACRCVTSTAIRNGALVRPDRCDDCGVRTPPDAHHDDYDQPLRVRWLCKPCHRTADVARRAAERRIAETVVPFPPKPAERAVYVTVWLTKGEKTDLKLMAALERVDESDMLRDHTISDIVARAACVRSRASLGREQEGAA